MTAKPTLQLVEQHIIRRGDVRWAAIDAASFAAKNIYNAANFRLRQEYIFKHRYMPFAESDKFFKQADLLPDQQLPAKVVQQVLRQLDHEWRSFFAAQGEWEAHPEKFMGRPRLPQYKHKTEGRTLLVYPENAYFVRELRKGVIWLSGLGRWHRRSSVRLMRCGLSPTRRITPSKLFTSEG